MNKIFPWIIGGIMLVVILVCGALFLFGNEKDKKAVAQPPVAESVVQTSGPAPRLVPPTPPRPLPTKTQINDCAETSREANNLSARDARRLQVGQKVVLVVNGQRREVTVAGGDHFWKMCRVALTDPVSARYHAAQKEVTALNEQVTVANREIVAAQAVVTAKTQIRDRLTTQSEAANRRLASAQTELNERAARAAERQAQAAVRARQQRPARTAQTTS